MKEFCSKQFSLSGMFLMSVGWILVTSCSNGLNLKETLQDKSQIHFYGPDNRSAQMTFSAVIEVTSVQPLVSADAVIKGRRLKTTEKHISSQIQHLFGALKEHPDYVNNPGIIQNKGSLHITGAKLIDSKTAEVSYTYSDKVVFQKAILDKPSKTIEFWLPRNPKTIYKKGFVPGSKANSCTDAHYNTEGDFWYFWNPFQEGCPIQESDLEKVKADLKVLPQTKNTFPYYGELLGDNGNGRQFHAVYIAGIDDNFDATDLGRKTFNDVAAGLVQDGYRATSTAQNASVYEKSFDGFDARIDMYLLDPNSTDFVTKAAEGMETGDVFIYDGHSGLGGYLDIGRFSRDIGRSLKLPVDKQQVFYFNGCSTYSYYNADYFTLKATAQDPAGTRKLDIVTTSIGADFAVGARQDLVLLRDLTQNARPSWQTILTDMYNIDPSLSPLNHINGDEDNPTSPNP